jgi:hypothetical protein
MTPYLLKRHRGKWVAVRRGQSRVVATGRSLDEVQSKRGVKNTDLVFLVPSRDSAIIL